MKIKIDHIDKIEGHAGFVAKIVNGDVEAAKIEIEQGKRLIEKLLIGRKYDEAPIISSRVCGICPTVHQITSIAAIENAFGVKPRPETIRWRRIMLYAQIVQSHGFHLFLLSMDKKILPVRDFANRLLEIIGGRAVHPITPEVGGFKKIPEKKAIKRLMKDYDLVLKEAGKLTFRFKNQPKFYRLTAFKALDEVYCGKEKTSEKNNKLFMLGALARVNLYSDKLNPKAKKLLNLKLPCHNPFMNTYCQAIEIVHFLEEIGKEIKQIRFTDQKVKYKVKAGAGTAVCEAPRGTLYHSYVIDKNGFIKKADLLTPTAQFIPNLEADLKKYVGRTRDEAKIRKLIRAYDPCITCAVR